MTITIEMAHDSLFCSLNDWQWKCLAVLLGCGVPQSLEEREALLAKIPTSAKSEYKLSRLRNRLIQILKEQEEEQIKERNNGQQ